MKPFMWNRRFVTVALLMTVALTGCEKPAPPPVTMRIGVYPLQSFLPYYVMQEQGFDKKNGLSFKESALAGGAGAIEAMVAGTIDLCPVVSIMPMLTAAEKGLVPDKIAPVATNDIADAEHPGTGVLVAHAVQRWRDLDARQIASNVDNSIPSAALQARLRQEGVSGYSLVAIPFANRGLALAGGNVAAAVMSEPYLTQSLLRGDGKLLDWIIGGAPFERAVYTSIVFSAEFLRRNPEGVKAYLRAHLAAVHWIEAHPEQARRVLARRFNLSQEVSAKVRLTHWPVDARSDPAMLDQNQQVLIQYGFLKRSVDSSRLHDETLLTEVRKEKR